MRENRAEREAQINGKLSWCFSFMIVVRCGNFMDPLFQDCMVAVVVFLKLLVSSLLVSVMSLTVICISICEEEGEDG